MKIKCGENFTNEVFYMKISQSIQYNYNYTVLLVRSVHVANSSAVLLAWRVHVRLTA